MNMAVYMAVYIDEYDTLDSSNNIFEIEIEKGVKFLHISIDLDEYYTNDKPKKLFYLSNCNFLSFINTYYSDKYYKIDKIPGYDIPSIDMSGIQKLKEELKLTGKIGVYSTISMNTE